MFRPVGSITDYNYSKALSSYSKEWNWEEMNGFLIKPAKWIPNNKMGFGDVNTTNKRHFQFSIGPNEQGVKFRQNVTPSKDGNTVELHVEQMQFSENVMRYQTSLEFLNRKISGLMSAIKGE